MLSCEGYKMFYGTATVTPVTGRPPFQATGTWLYKPEYKCWYCQPDTGFCSSYPALIVSDFKEETVPV